MAKDTLLQRYWSRVDKRGPDECWNWTGTTSRGYGKFYDGVAMRRAHRYAWQFAHGEWPGEWHVLHSCDNPLCQNPAHLKLGTHADNMREMEQRGRAKYVRGEAHGKSRLTTESVKTIRAMRADGETLHSIASAIGVTIATIHNVVTGRTWSHVE